MQLKTQKNTAFSMCFARCFAEIKDRGNQAFTAAKQILFFIYFMKKFIISTKNVIFAKPKEK